jgi:hypothetical protein
MGAVVCVVDLTCVLVRDPSPLMAAADVRCTLSQSDHPDLSSNAAMSVDAMSGGTINGVTHTHTHTKRTPRLCYTYRLPCQEVPSGTYRASISFPCPIDSDRQASKVTVLISLMGAVVCVVDLACVLVRDPSPLMAAADGRCTLSQSEHPNLSSNAAMSVDAMSGGTINGVTHTHTHTQSAHRACVTLTVYLVRRYHLALLALLSASLVPSTQTDRRVR